MLSPVRYGQRKFRAGGTSGSVFSLIAATLGSGTISFPYAVMMNGYILGPLLILIGAGISYYTGMLIVKASEKTGRTRYEDIALAIYG
jgi:amino acid permease